MMSAFLKRGNLAIIIAVFAFFLGWGLSAHAAMPFGSPRASAVDAQLNQLYVIDDANSRLLVLDPATVTVIREVSLPVRPTGVMVYEPTHEVFINSFYGAAIYIFDGTALGQGGTGTVEPRNSITGSGNPLFMKFVPTLNAFFVFDNVGNRIFIYDLSTKALRNTLFFREEINDWAFDAVLNKLYASSIHSPLLYMVTFPQGALPVVKRLQPSDIVYQLTVDSKHHVLLANTFSDSTILWDTATDKEIKKIDAGRTADALMDCSEKFGKCYIANFWAHSVTVIDAVKKQVIKTIHVGEAAHPASVSFDEEKNRVFVLTPGNYKLVVIDAVTDEIVKEIQTGIVARGESIHGSTHDIFVPNYESGTITVVSGDDLSSRAVPQLPEGDYYVDDPKNLLAHPGGSASYQEERKLYVADLGGKLYVLDADSYRIKKSFEVGEQIHQMAIDLNRKYLFAVSNMASELYIVDLARDEIVKTIKLDSSLGPLNEYKVLVLRGIPDAIILTDFHHDTLFVIDTATLEVKKRYEGFGHVSSLATDSAKSEIYIMTFLEGKVHVLDGKTFEKKREFVLPRPNYASVFAVDYIRHKMYFAKGPRVFAIDPDNGKVLKTIPLNHPGATSMVILPEYNRLYVGLHHGVEAVDLDRDEVVASFDVENHHNSLLFYGATVYAYANELVASEKYLYSFDARTDTILAKVPLNNQIISKLSIPSYDPISGRAIIPEGYGQQLSIVDLKEQKVKVVQVVPEAKIFGLSPTTFGIGVALLALLLAVGYVLVRMRAGRGKAPAL